MTHFELVGEFHDVFDHPHRTEPYTEVFDKEPQLLQSRLSFMREEYDEFRDALEKMDQIEMADALCDLNYFVYGTGHCLGINLDIEIEKNGLVELVQAPNNMPKFIKPLDQETCEIIRESLIPIDSLINEFKEACSNRDFEMIRTCLVRLISLTNILGYKLGYDMDQLFREVHRANMTKVCHTLEDAEESVRFYLEDGRYTNPTYKTKGQYYVVYNDDGTDKVLKNHKWTCPDFSKIMIFS